jgi:hypothetical protein
MESIASLYKSYTKAKMDISSAKFYGNKIDVFKLTFDAKFNDVKEEKIIETEMLRQLDKSINNSIGTFHEDILGGIEGYEKGNLSGFDIRAKDNSLFADIKNKHNTMNSNSEEGLFQKLARYADDNKKAKCYWVQILAKKSFSELWTGDINGKEYSHSRVFKISGDQFYHLVTKEQDAFFQLYKILPKAIDDFLLENRKSSFGDKKSALVEIKNQASESQRSIMDQITFDNYCYYLGFEKL